MGRTIRTALIGYGFGGAVFHAPFIEAAGGLQLAAVATSRKEEVQARWPGVRVVADPADIWRDAGIELVVISTPNATHASLARQALEADKHVVIDKPFVVDPAEGESLIRLARERGRILSVYHNRRFDSDFRTVQRLLGAGMLGDINYYEARYDRFRPEVKDRWKERDEPGSGALYDLGSHLVDQALQLFGMPETVTADCRSQRAGSGSCDYFHMLLGYKGLQVVLHSGSLVRVKGPRFTIHGSKASYVKYGDDPQERALLAGAKPRSPGWGVEPEEEYGLLYEAEHSVGTPVPGESGDYTWFYEQLYAALTAGAPLPVEAGQALDVIRVIVAAAQSSDEGRTVRML